MISAKPRCAGCCKRRGHVPAVWIEPGRRNVHYALCTKCFGIIRRNPEGAAPRRDLIARIELNLTPVSGRLH